MSELVLEITAVEETAQLGRIIADLLKPKDVLGLCGDLGAGKTFLAGCIAHALGIPESIPITSPTFTLIKEYRQGRLPVYHMDLYRLGDPSELYELGLWEYYDGDGVCLVEWSNLFEDLWPNQAMIIHIALGEGERRTITVTGRFRGQAIVETLASSWQNR